MNIVQKLIKSIETKIAYLHLYVIKYQHERKILNAFLKNGEYSLSALMRYLKYDCPPFKQDSSWVYKSITRMITVKHSTWGGYIIRINKPTLIPQFPKRNLLDLNYYEYGITKEQATLLYRAILAHVPDTTEYYAKAQKKLDEVVNKISMPKHTTLNE